MALACLWQSVLRRVRCSRTYHAFQHRPSAAFGATAVSRAGAGASAEPRDVMEYDVCIVGAGPAGLSAAIRLKQVRHASTFAHIGCTYWLHILVAHSPACDMQSQECILRSSQLDVSLIPALLMLCCKQQRQTFSQRRTYQGTYKFS